MKPRIQSLREYREFQREICGALFLPLTSSERLRKSFPDGQSVKAFAEQHIAPNDRLTSFERLEIYSRSYWFRVLNSFSEDFPGLRAVLGDRRFFQLAEAYLIQFPSESFTLRDLGSRLEQFLIAQPQYAGRRFDLALDTVRLEWAQVVAFDAAALPAITLDDLPGNKVARMRFALQPHVTLLACNFPVDHFAMAVRKQDALHEAASNAIADRGETTPAARPKFPHREPCFLAIHRSENRVYIKRLDRLAHTLFMRLQEGRTLSTACTEAIAQGLNDPSPEVGAAQIGEWLDYAARLGWLCRRS